MKKKLVCLAVLLLAMVLMPKKARAERIVHKFCQNCNQVMECTIRSSIDLDTDQTKHKFTCCCVRAHTFTVTERHYDDDATCTNQGFCAFCGYWYIDSSVHSWGSWVDNGDGTHSQGCKYNSAHKSAPANHTFGTATCVSPLTCSDCGATQGDINPDNHSWGAWQDNGDGTHIRYCTLNSNHKQTEKHSGGGATCTTVGTCTVCNGTYKDPEKHTGASFGFYEKISDYQHQEKRIYTCCQATVFGTPASHTETTSATCTTAAFCTICGDHYGSTDSSNHAGPFKTTYEKISDDKHKVTVTCEGCGKTSSETTEGHIWSDWNSNDYYHSHSCYCGATVTAPHTSNPRATCVTPQLCSTCNNTYLDPSNHAGTIHTTYVIYAENEFEHVVTKTCDACKQTVDTRIETHQVDTNTTCTQGAHCALCSSYYGKPLGHDMGRWKPTEDGKQHYRTCSRDCGEIEFDDHDVTQQATCDSEAYCRICGPFGEFDNTAHNWDAWQYYNDDQHYRCCLYNSAHEEYADHIEGTAATCDTPATCQVCGQSYGSALGHDTVKHDAKAPTCTEIGWEEYETCKNCDYSTYKELPALGHDLVKHDAKAPTCTEIGWEEYETCKNCDYSTYKELPALGHDTVKHDAKAPACTEIGWEDYETCKNCDYSTYKELSALGHDTVKHDAKAPTCTEPGWEEYETCKNCDYSTYKELPALGHSYTTEFTKPTCTAPGSTIRTCQRCKQSTTEQTGSTLSHWYGEWKPERHGSNGTHIAGCLRWCGHQLSIPCTLVSYTRMLTDGQTEKLDLCPVCGQVSDGSRLELVKDAKAAALTRELPAGEVVVRMGVMENGQALVSVAFEISGKLTQPTGQVKITLPAALLDGNSLCLLDEDGRETELEFDIQKEEASFVLDFTPNQLDEEKEPSPTALIRLVPAE